MSRLLSQLTEEATPAGEPTANLCRGPFLSRLDYRQAIEHWGYQNPSLAPPYLESQS
jgi:hypothetical protein